CLVIFSLMLFVLAKPVQAIMLHLATDDDTELCVDNSEEDSDEKDSLDEDEKEDSCLNSSFELQQFSIKSNNNNLDFNLSSDYTLGMVPPPPEMVHLFV
ncbi:MAG: hypothetical protein ACI837_003215, partial [Crocinitomicaceae bacterium]